MSDLVENPEDRFSHDEAQISSNTHLISSELEYYQGMQHRHNKTCLRVSDQVRHKPGCTAIKDGLRLTIFDPGRSYVPLFSHLPKAGFLMTRHIYIFAKLGWSVMMLHSVTQCTLW